jgi:hypothetical protein
LSRIREPEKDRDRLIEPNDVLVVEAADPNADFGFRHRGDLVDHQPGRRAQTVPQIGLDWQTDQRRFVRIGCESTNGYGIGFVEGIVLNDDDRSRLARIVGAAAIVQISPRFTDRSDRTRMMNA